jgi:hypothetical protein
VGWTTDILVGLAERIDTAGIGTYEATAAYDPAATVPVITLQGLPDLPNKAIALAYFSNGGTGGVTAAVEITVRGDADPTSPDQIADAVWTLLDNAADFLLGGVHVALMYRQTSAPLGLDAAGRWSRGETYFLIADRPSVNWPDL